MQLQQSISLQATLLLEDNLPQDDIDRVFNRLQHVEPPPSLVSRVLNQMPFSTTPASLVAQPVAWHNLDHWVVKNKKRQLC